jgi:hypothetical protein
MQNATDGHRVSPFRLAYAAGRYAALGSPLTEAEQAAELRARLALGECLDLAPAPAAYYGRRCLLFHRDACLHEALALDLPGAHVPELLEFVSVIGLEHLSWLDPSRGILLLSLHYGPYSSLLVWWLAAATARGSFEKLTVLLRSTGAGQYQVSEQRLAEFEAAGVWPRSRITLFDRETAGPAGTVARLSARLGHGEAVLMFPDAALRPHDDDDDDELSLKVGRSVFGLPRGAVWLARDHCSAVVPVYIRPHGDSAHAVVIGRPVQPRDPSEAHAAVSSALQYLVEDAVQADPSPWGVWMREGLGTDPV